MQMPVCTSITIIELDLQKKVHTRLHTTRKTVKIRGGNWKLEVQWTQCQNNTHSQTMEMTDTLCVCAYNRNIFIIKMDLKKHYFSYIHIYIYIGACVFMCVTMYLYTRTWELLLELSWWIVTVVIQNSLQYTLSLAHIAGATMTSPHQMTAFLRLLQTAMPHKDVYLMT